MADSEVAICNSALSKLGASRITNLDDDSKSAKLCKEQFPKLRDEVLRAHPWNFAIARATLSELATSPEYDFDNQYPMPADALRILSTDLERPIIWAVEGRMILCNASSLKVRYIKKITDTTQFDVNFDEALALRLASDLAYALVQSSTLQAQLFNVYTSQLAIARSMDAQEGNYKRMITADVWTDARF